MHHADHNWNALADSRLARVDTFGIDDEFPRMAMGRTSRGPSRGVRNSLLDRVAVVPAGRKSACRGDIWRNDRRRSDLFPRHHHHVTTLVCSSWL